MKHVNITVMLKQDGYKSVKIPVDFLGKLALSINQFGHEWLTLMSGTIDVVGFMVVGKETGERVIILGKSDGESHG